MTIELDEPIHYSPDQVVAVCEGFDFVRIGSTIHAVDRDSGIALTNRVHVVDVRAAIESMLRETA